jgi:hypothetical protein
MKEIVAFVCCAVLAIAVTAATKGVAANVRYGTEVTETLAPGASAGEIVMKHGAPDTVTMLGTSGDKYLMQYWIRSKSSFVGNLSANERRMNICYLVEKGRVMGGGYVGGGASSSFLGADHRLQLLLLVLGLGLVAVAGSLKRENRGALLGAATLGTGFALALAWVAPLSLAVTAFFAYLFWRAYFEACCPLDPEASKGI